MSISARLTFSQVGIFVSIIVFLAVRGFFVVLKHGLLWTSVGAYFDIALPLLPVIILGFAACVISYAYSYLGLWFIDNEKFILGIITIFLSVIIAPGALGAYSWIFYPLPIP
ncbi:MAG: conserved membrane protein of unknown function [Candidatus Thorarchaeota archaeon]|nr:MAG: conserved membrane protein of unknown function [Candidatus Thorarchaeota archaeon]